MLKYLLSLLGQTSPISFFYSPDTGTGSGGAPTSSATPPDNSTSQGSQASDSTPGQTSPVVTEEMKKNPDELLKVIALQATQLDTVTKQRDKGEKTLKEIKEKGEKQRQKELEEQGNFKKLHEEAQTRLTTLEAENKTLTAAVAGFLKDTIAGVSPELQKKLQSDEYKDNPLKQLELLTTLRDVGAFKIKEGKGDGTPPADGKEKVGLGAKLKSFYGS